MRLLANENVAPSVIHGLRLRGHDVFSVKETIPSATDRVILAQAQIERRIVLTHDKDFGVLAIQSGLPATCGVILLRVAGNSSVSDRIRIIEALESRSDWEGHFAVVEQDRIRLRRLS